MSNKGLHAVTMGEIMVQMNALTPGPLRHVVYFEKHAAGAEANVAVGLRRMGLQSGFIGRVGEDEFGKYLLSWLKSQDVDVSRVKVDNEAPTAVYFIQRSFPIPGQSRVFYYRKGSAGSRLSASDVDEDYIINAELFHITGITPALSSSCREATEKAVKLVKEEGLTLSFDTNIRPVLWAGRDEAKRVLLPLMKRADIVFTDPSDSSILIGSKDPGYVIEQLMSMGVKTVIFKLGAEGIVVRKGDEELRMSSFKTYVEDPVGAGDALASGFLAGMIKGLTLKECAEIGMAAASLVVTVRGDQESLPTFHEAKELIDHVKSAKN